MDKEIVIKEATKEKAELVDTNIEAILDAKKGVSIIAGLTVKRIKNVFIIL